MRSFKFFLKNYMNVDLLLLVLSILNVGMNVIFCLQHFLSRQDDLDALFAHAWTASGAGPLMILCNGLILYGCIRSRFRAKKLGNSDLEWQGEEDEKQSI